MIRALALVLALWVGPAFAQAYTEASRVFVIASQPAMYDHIGASNCNTPSASANCAPGPHLVDLRGVHPMMVSAKAVRVDGILIITHGPTAGTADLKVALDSSANPNFGCPYIVGQTIEANGPSPVLLTQGGGGWSLPGGGQRSNMGAWVPVSNGQIKMCSTFTGPSDSTWAVTLTVTEFLL